METIVGSPKTEVIRRRCLWRHLKDVELASLASVEWFDHGRLFEPIGDTTPAEKQEETHQNQVWATVA